MAHIKNKRKKQNKKYKENNKNYFIKIQIDVYGRNFESNK